MLKTVSSLSVVTGSLNYSGAWDASTNNPALASGVGTKGDYYVVSVSGSTNLDGITSWVVSDWAVFNGTVWQKVDNSEIIYVSNVATGTGLTGGPITSTGTISLANTAVTIGTYGGATNVASFTVDQQGRLTGASNVTIAIGNSNLQNSNVVLGNTTLTLGSTVSNVGNLTLENVTILGGTTNAAVFNFTGNTTATATYGTASLPLQPAGFMQVNLNGVVVKVPYYAV
jgi:trimeric autotransporter adhesin